MGGGHSAGVPPPGLNLEAIAQGVPELVAGAARGDAAAQRELYRRARPRVVRVAQAFASLDQADVEDVVQETFVKAFRAIDQLKTAAQFEPWLLTIARNRAISLHRRRAAERTASAEPSEEAAELFPEALRTERDAAVVRQLIDELPEGEEKETARLFYVEGSLSAREIAERMGVGKSAFTMRLERFRARL